MAEDERKVTIHYQKSPSFQTVYVDGFYGGVTPSLQLFLAGFCERPVIPETVAHFVKEDDSLGEPIPAEGKSKKGIIREVEVSFVMSRTTAQHLIDWLQKQIETAQKLEEKGKGAREKTTRRGADQW